jgi:hypothetical protein
MTGCPDLSLLAAYATVPATLGDRQADIDRHTRGCAECARQVDDLRREAAALERAEPFAGDRPPPWDHESDWEPEAGELWLTRGPAPVLVFICGVRDELSQEWVEALPAATDLGDARADEFCLWAADTTLAMPLRLSLRQVLLLDGGQLDARVGSLASQRLESLIGDALLAGAPPPERRGRSSSFAARALDPAAAKLWALTQPRRDAAIDPMPEAEPVRTAMRRLQLRRLTQAALSAAADEALLEPQDPLQLIVEEDGVEVARVVIRRFTGWFTIRQASGDVTLRWRDSGLPVDPAQRMTAPTTIAELADALAIGGPDADDR